MKKPVIGITLDLINNEVISKFPCYTLGQHYANSIIHAGGIPIMIPYQEGNINKIINVIDGLIIPGGDLDVPPKLYGQEIVSDKVKLHSERTDFEIALLDQAINVKIPFLGICNGMQLFNVYCGGSLYQHLPDYIDSNIKHEQPHPKHIPSHSVMINHNTLLSKLATDQKVFMVNSTHHQAVDRLGQGLVASAIAEDGVIEAIELPSQKFAIGLQWHPEYLGNTLDISIFRSFIEVASGLL